MTTGNLHQEAMTIRNYSTLITHCAETQIMTCSLHRIPHKAYQATTDHKIHEQKPALGVEPTLAAADYETGKSAQLQ